MILPNREANEATLSALQHFAFCRRQWGLIFLERQWAENARTAEGQVFHQTAHHGPESEARGDLLILRGLRVASPALRLGGVCDVVELHRSPSGVSLAGREGLWLPYPVEYKRGSDQTRESDEVQLCGQALCLEEMLCCQIPEGSLFYGETRRRTRVAFDETLRQRTLDLLHELLGYMDRGYTPGAKFHKGCNACSLRDVCLPKLSRAPSVADYVHARAGEEEPCENS